MSKVVRQSDANSETSYLYKIYSLLLTPYSSRR
jgi:hypothetical protein